MKGIGAKYLVSDLGQFDFKNGRMRLTHIHPGVVVARIVAKTGFELEIAEPLSVTEPLTVEELRLLNEAIDPLGIRKLELLSGAKRRLALGEILEKERAQLI